MNNEHGDLARAYLLCAQPLLAQAIGAKRADCY